MGLLSSTADTIYAIRFLRLLTTPWKSTGAYKLGLIDFKGQHLKSPSNSVERSKYNVFHRLVFNLKRLLNKIPLGKTTIASYISALYLLKEHTGLSDDKIIQILEKYCGKEIGHLELNESLSWYNKGGILQKGQYVLLNDIIISNCNNECAYAGSAVLVTEDSKPVGSICGYDMYEAYHFKTNQLINISILNLTH